MKATEIRYNATGARKKELVKAVSELTGAEIKYAGVPTCCYNGGGFTISKAGTLLGEVTQELLDGLAERGFVDPDNTTVEADFNESLTVEIPKEGFGEEAQANLKRMIESKARLFKKALGTDDLTITETETTLQFPWFTLTAPEEAEAYAQFITALCETAKNKKRVNAKETETDNEKFTFRVFMIGLGLKGGEFKLTRKLMLQNLEGNSAFRFGKPEKEEETAAEETEQATEADTEVEAEPETENSAE